MKTVFTRMAAVALIAVMLIVPPAQAAYSTLEFGSRGNSVLQLQRALLALGFDPNGTDGKFGRGTEKAVIAYQKSRGLEADGKAGNLTLTKLYSETDGSTSSGSTDSAAPSPSVPSTTRRPFQPISIRPSLVRVKPAGTVTVQFSIYR